MRAAIIPTAIAGLLAATLPAQAARGSDPHTPPPAHRIFALNRQGGAAALSLEQFVGELAPADVVICGEYHDDPATHKMELVLLEQLAARHQGALAMSMEMFERDVQAALDAYLQGSLSEREFLTQSRPWGNYADYRPLVEYCRKRGQPVIAANPPTALARHVAREGMLAMRAALDPAQHAWLAAATSAPDDGYWERFADAMGGSDPTHGGMAEDKLRQFYAAQCLKDDTMAESILVPVGPPPFSELARRPVLHFNGSFHSDYGYGVAQRVRQRAPELRVYTIAIRPIPDFTPVSQGGSLDPHGETLADGTPVADFVIFVPAPPAVPAS